MVEGKVESDIDQHTQILLERECHMSGFCFGYLRYVTPINLFWVNFIFLQNAAIAKRPAEGGGKGARFARLAKAKPKRSQSEAMALTVALAQQ